MVVEGEELGGWVGVGRKSSDQEVQRLPVRSQVNPSPLGPRKLPNICEKKNQLYWAFCYLQVAWQFFIPRSQLKITNVALTISLVPD